MNEHMKGHDRADSNTHPYSGRFILRMALLTAVTLGLQSGLIWLTLEDWRSQGQSNFAPIGPLGQFPSSTILPNCTVIFQNEVWAAITPATPAFPGAVPVRPASSRLVAFDLKTGKPRETNVLLSPAPLGLVVVDDQLWGVAESVVYRIEDGEVLPRHPRRNLIDPSRPFVYQGRLAVIDVKSGTPPCLLTWHDGEWTDEGSIDVPIQSASTRFTSDLRVVSNDEKSVLIYLNGLTIQFREGINYTATTAPVATPVPEPVSALNPENQVNLDQMMARTLPQAGILTLPGWKSMPISSSWGTTWEVAVINDAPWVFNHSGPYSDNQLQQYKMHGGNWVKVVLEFPPAMRGFGIAGGSRGYLVTDDLRLFSLKDSTIQRVAPGVPITERFRSVLTGFKLLARYLLLNGLLMLGSWRLMRVHRTAEYEYGKRKVILASILLRGCARGIDLMITLFPAVFWLSVAMDSRVMSQFQTQSGIAAFGIQIPATFFVFSIFGMWIGISLVMAFMEGNWGCTPGKWLFGIRTLRTTLRPCGMLRAFAREFLVYLDSLLLLSWLPGVLFIAFTPHWQRWGDIAADTVVVLDPKR